MPSLTAALVADSLPARRADAAPPALAEAELRRRMAETLGARPPGAALRLFAYGALMWEAPRGAAARPARLPGLARAFCLRDIDNRGTPEAPGLTTGLVPGEGCGGLLLDLPDERALWSAWRQEMRPGFYRAEWRDVAPLAGGAGLPAITFLADPAHPLWAGVLPENSQAEVLARSVGPQGPGAEYLRRTEEMLRAAGLPDAGLARLCGLVAGRLGQE